MMWIVRFFTRNFFGGGLTSKLKEAFDMYINAETQEAKLEAEKQIALLSAQRDIILAEQGKWYTAWIRPMIALPVVIFIWKILVWDTVLQWGVTPYPGDFVFWIVTSVITAYFVTRPIEKIFRR